MKKCVSTLSVLTLFLFFGLVGQTSAADNATTGAALYQGCVPCHGSNSNGMSAKPVDQIIERMHFFQNGNFTKPKIIQMQSLLKPLSQQKIELLAAHIKTL